MNEQMTKKRRTMNEQMTKKRRTMNEQWTNKRGRKCGVKAKGS